MMSSMTEQWVRNASALAQEVDAEFFLLAAASDAAMHLNSTASLVWELLHEPRSLATLASGVLAAYDGEHDAVVDDIYALLLDLERAGLVRRISASCS